MNINTFSIVTIIIIISILTLCSSQRYTGALVDKQSKGGVVSELQVRPFQNNTVTNNTPNLLNSLANLFERHQRGVNNGIFSKHENYSDVNDLMNSVDEQFSKLK